MKNKNLPNKLTNARIIITIIILFILLFPFSMINVNFKKYLINDTIIIDTKMIIVGVLFVISSITDFLDGYLARKYHNESDYGKLMDPIADKLSIDSILIALSAYGYIPSIIPIIVIMRDTIVDGIRMLLANMQIVESSRSLGKCKTLFLMLGIILKLFSNLPFGLINISIDDFFLVAGTVLSFISGLEYMHIYKKYIVNKE